MGFLDWLNVALVSGWKALICGFVMYFVLFWVSLQWSWPTVLRFALTFVAIIIPMVPDFYHLLVAPDVVAFLEDKSLAPDALWLAIKAKFWAGLVGHALAYIAHEYFS
ncbi:hypothetical protein GJ698_22115 [Pseudoduganella sp. FT26W]|uniref:Uncharacterized protein n=1 Tax=Duganella aquatilis TaxID=2666082 RepID=A0A844DEP7_9BURK|nr:hypothetical protein [Duganella aquatilis]MRW86770.1 hypothetical protein [Duganella aquatilis]